MSTFDAVDGSTTGNAMFHMAVFLEIAEWRLLAHSGHFLQCGIMSALGGKADIHCNGSADVHL